MIEVDEIFPMKEIEIFQSVRSYEKKVSKTAEIYTILKSAYY